MPIDYKKYPANWKTEIRPAILKRAENKCEICGVPNKAYGFRVDTGEFINSELEMDLLESYGVEIWEGEKMITIVLTISHTDHDINNNDYNNLRALCQQCHFRHDINHHKKTRRTKKGTAIYELF